MYVWGCMTWSCIRRRGPVALGRSAGRGRERMVFGGSDHARAGGENVEQEQSTDDAIDAAA